MHSKSGLVRHLPVWGALWLLSFLSSPELDAQEVPGCGNLENAYGPYDYTNPTHVAKQLPRVEAQHFRANTERLEKDSDHRRAGREPGADLDYTLRAFPNHHRALYAMATLQLETRQAPPPKAKYTAECYFERAIAFRPSDGVVRMIYGVFLHKNGDLRLSLQQYDHAAQLLGDFPELHYNMGLLYMDLRDFDAALKHAHIAYAGRFPLPGLRDQLVAAGRWRTAAAEEADNE